MSKYNINGDIPDNVKIVDEYNIGIDADDFIEILDTKLKTAKEARSKKSNGSSSWEFWNGKIRAYEEIKHVINKESA